MILFFVASIFPKENKVYPGSCTLGHTFCKELVNKGAPLGVVAELAGHSSLETTRLYTVPGEEELQHAVDRLNWE